MNLSTQISLHQLGPQNTILKLSTGRFSLRLEAQRSSYLVELALLRNTSS